MNAAQVHLALTHLPVILTLTGLTTLIVSLFIKKNLITKVASIILIAAGVFAIPVFLSGEGAEEIVEEVTGVTGSMIEEHEDIARYSFYAVLITAVISLASLFRFSIKWKRSLNYLVLIVGLITTGLMVYTAHLGGQIRHSEIQNSSLAAESGINASDDNDDD